MMKLLGIVVLFLADSAFASPPYATLRVPAAFPGREVPVVLAIDGVAVSAASSYELAAGVKHTVKFRCGAAGAVESAGTFSIVAGQELKLRCVSRPLPKGRIWVVPAMRPNDSSRPTPPRGAA
jgi:hypothetical protein